MQPSSQRRAYCNQAKCLKYIKKFNSKYKFTHGNKSRDDKKVKFDRVIDSQQSALKTFFQKQTSTKENAGSIINLSNTNSMTKSNSPNNPLVNSTRTETEIPQVRENTRDSVISATYSATQQQFTS